MSQWNSGGSLTLDHPVIAILESATSALVSLRTIIGFFVASAPILTIDTICRLRRWIRLIFCV